MKLFSFLLVSLILLFLACLYEDPVAPEGEDGNSDSCSYTVTYDDQGATTPVNPSIQAAVPPAMTVDSLPTPPSKMCYVFSGWYTQPNGSGMQFNASTAVTTDITVYAHWIHYDYIVTFNDQGAITPTYPTTIMIYCPRTTVGQLPTPPSKIGWVFGGWWTKPNGGGTEFTASTVVSANITVYAFWACIDYIVTFDDQGATTHAYPTTMTIASPCTTVRALPTPPSKTGYTFGGWYTQPNGEGTEFTESTAVTTSITVYAKWIEE